jgi:hypothetical protein
MRTARVSDIEIEYEVIGQSEPLCPTARLSTKIMQLGHTDAAVSRGSSAGPEDGADLRSRTELRICASFRTDIAFVMPSISADTCAAGLGQRSSRSVI